MGMAISDWLVGFITSAKNFPSLTGMEGYCILDWDRFFDVVRVFGTTFPVRDMILSAIDAINFFPFVYLNGTLTIVVVSSAIIAAGEEPVSEPVNCQCPRNAKTSDNYSTAWALLTCKRQL